MYFPIECLTSLSLTSVQLDWLEQAVQVSELIIRKKAKQTVPILTNLFNLFIHRLWGAVNILYCHRCSNYFQCSELGHCCYHPMTVDFGNMECTSTKIVGVYPCCQQRVLHFDPSLETSVS